MALFGLQKHYSSLVEPSFPANQITPSNQHSSPAGSLTEIQSSPKRQSIWTAHEDELLKKSVLELGEAEWRKISQQIPGKSSLQCNNRWSKILKPGLVKGQWTKEEDQKLILWVQEHGPTQWAKAAEFLQGRNGKQCRERWLNNLNPDVKKGGWTKEEDNTLIEMFKKYGSSWCKIAKFLPGRSENAIKNRFHSNQRKLMGNKRKERSSKLHSEIEEEGDSKLGDSTPEQGKGQADGPNTLCNRLQEVNANNNENIVDLSMPCKKVCVMGSKGEKYAKIHRYEEGENHDPIFENFLLSENKEHVHVEEAERQGESDALDDFDRLQARILSSYDGGFENLLKTVNQKFELLDSKSSLSGSCSRQSESQENFSPAPVKPFNLFSGSKPSVEIKRERKQANVTVLTYTPECQISSVQNVINLKAAKLFSDKENENMRIKKELGDNRAKNFILGKTEESHVSRSLFFHSYLQNYLKAQQLLASGNMNNMRDRQEQIGLLIHQIDLFEKEVALVKNELRRYYQSS